MAKKKVEIQVKISDASLDDVEPSVWLEGTFIAKVPKKYAKKIPAIGIATDLNEAEINRFIEKHQ